MEYIQMALNDTPWCGHTDDKLYLQSGQFTSTLKTSLLISSIELVPAGISYDGTDTPWIGFGDQKLYLQSGQFSSTLKDSELVSGINTQPVDISWDGFNTPWTGDGGIEKLYLQSGQFTSTLKTSWDVTAVDDQPDGISWDATNTPWAGQSAMKLYLQSGQFSSTLKTSVSIGGIEASPDGISYDGTNTPWSGYAGVKLYLQSGQFTSTLKTSEDVSGIDTGVGGIDTNNVAVRLGAVSVVVTPPALAIVSALEAPLFPGMGLIVSVSELSLSTATQAPTAISDAVATPTVLTLGLLQEGLSVIAGTSVYISLLPLTLGASMPGAPVVLGDAILLRPDTTMISQEVGLSLHAPSINIENDTKTIVSNTRNFAISEYTNFGFNSMCKFNGKYLYANSNGIYEGGGGNDDGAQIHASYKTGAIDTYTTEIQRLRNCYLIFRSDGDIQLFSVGDEINARAYYISSSVGSTIHERRVKLERGIRDRHFNFGISNINGSSLEVDSAKILSEPIKKRR